MDNAAYVQDSDTSPKEIHIPLQTRIPEVNVMPAENVGTCGKGPCRSMRSMRAMPPDASGGACYKNYNKILIVLLLLFVIWIVVYTVLSELNML